MELISVNELGFFDINNEKGTVAYTVESSKKAKKHRLYLNELVMVHDHDNNLIGMGRSKERDSHYIGIEDEAFDDTYPIFDVESLFTLITNKVASSSLINAKSNWYGVVPLMSRDLLNLKRCILASTSRTYSLYFITADGEQNGLLVMKSDWANESRIYLVYKNTFSELLDVNHTENSPIKLMRINLVDLPNL